MVDGCRACELVARRDAGIAPTRDAIARTPGWDVADCFDTSVEGWTVLVLRRHAASMAELTGQEAAELGPLLKAISEGLAVVATGCERTYVEKFAESPPHRHVHFHVVPRAANLADDQRGPRIFASLGRPESERVPEAKMEQIAIALRRELTVRGVGVDSAAPVSPSSGRTPFIPLPEGLPDPRRSAGAVFDRIVDLYDRARPSYRAAAAEDLVRSCELTASASFDLVVTATSFHWVDPTIAYPKAAGLLRPGRRLALLTNAHTDGGSHTHPPFVDAVLRLQHRLAPATVDWNWTFPTAEEIATRAAGGGNMACL
jgi:diadenosine tetraphosphate (Ap4A) HIT family hydrolase